MADEALQQITFLGASITSFNVNLGWSGSPSSLTIDLVEDDTNGDSFLVPQAGSAQFFSYGSFIFGGIVQKWVATGNINGLPTFQVIMNDPRDLLNGVQLILNGYTGVTYSVPNLYNIFGYLENTVGFGSSHLNDSGMPWKKVRDTFLTLQNSTPISFRNDTYTIDLSALPVMADEYRIGGGVSITLMDFINQICGDSSHDYFFYLDLGNVLRLVTINRQEAPTLGLLSQYIGSTNGVSSKEVGVELRNEVCSKFVVGGKECKMFFNNFQYQYYLDSNSEGEIDDVNLRTYYTDLEGNRFDIDYESMTLQQYWGLDKDGNVILPKIYETYIEDSEITDFEEVPSAAFNPAVGPAIEGGDVERNWVYRAIRLDTRGLEVLGLGEWYDTDEQEMRALLAGYNSWVAFLALNDKKLDSAHSDKFTRFNMTADFDPTEYALAVKTGDFSHFKPIDPKDFSPLKGKMVRLIADSTGRTHEENLKTIYNKFHDYAQEYYGKKFMVRIPFVLATIDDNQVAETAEASELGASTNTDVIRTTMQPAELGYLEEDLWDDAVSQNYLPLDFYKFQSPDDRFEAYVRFDSAYRLDVSDIAERDYALGVQYQQKRKDNNAEDLSFFVRAKAEPNLVFLDRATATSPRAVITLPGQVRNLLDSADAVEDRATFDGLFRNDITKKLVDFKSDFLQTYWTTLPLKIKQDYSMMIPGDPGTTWDGSFTDRVAWYYYTTVLIPKIGNEQVFFGNDGTPLNPSMVALPLLSNINTYGPWYIIGQNGKVEFEQDENLVPWNYGNYTYLNAAANAKVVEAVSNQLDSETGTLEFPGIPSTNLGGSLISGGPYVTGLDVNVGQNGVTTTYRMETWTQRFGRESKQQIDKLQKTVTKMQQQKQAIYNLYGKNTPGNAALQPIIKQKFADDVKRRSASSSHGFIIGELLGDGSGLNQRANVAVAPTYNLAAAIGGVDYSGKALMTVDGLLRPFSTSPTYYWNLPHFETPTSSGSSGRSVTELNPFQTGNDIHTIAQGSVIPDDVHLRNMNDAWKRPLALRGPLVVAGWGYDTAGKPVPNERLTEITNYSDVFASGHLTRSDLWKVGPVDLKWHNERKVWVTGGASLNIARLDAVLTAGGNAIATIQNISISGVTLVKTNGNNITVYDMLTPASYGLAIAPSGAFVYVQQETTSGRYTVTGVGGW